jgi:hypothetical protein
MESNSGHDLMSFSKICYPVHGASSNAFVQFSSCLQASLPHSIRQALSFIQVTLDDGADEAGALALRGASFSLGRSDCVASPPSW